MENRDAQNSQQDPTTSQQNRQQPTSQNETDGGEMGQNGQSSDGQAQSGGAIDSQQPNETGQSDYGSAGQSGSLTEQRSDTERSASQSSEQGSQAPGFIGQTGGTDSSSELVEDSQDFDKDGQGSIEGE